MNFQSDIPSIPFDNFKDYYVPLFDFTSMQDVTEILHYPEIVGEPLRLQLNFTFPLEHVTELLVLGERLSSVAVDNFGVALKKSKLVNLSLHQTIDRMPQLKYRNLGSFLSEYVPALDNDTFAIISTQPSNMQDEHWTMIANSHQKIYFADSVGRPSSLKQQYKQMMPEPLQFFPRVCVFCTIYAVFHLFKFRQEEIAGVHDVNVVSVIFNYM